MDHFINKNAADQFHRFVKLSVLVHPCLVPAWVQLTDLATDGCCNLISVIKEIMYDKTMLCERINEWK